MLDFNEDKVFKIELKKKIKIFKINLKHKEFCRLRPAYVQLKSNVTMVYVTMVYTNEAKAFQQHVVK